MHPSDPQTAPLLLLLEAEERLLADSREGLARVYEALRRGDLTAVEALRPEQEAVASALQVAQARRAGVARNLAAGLGLPAEDLTLSALAATLPEPVAAELLAARDRLAAAFAAAADVQRRNANLIGRLRSYFRGVLADLTAADVPVRYGPSGGRVAPAAGTAIQARG